MLTPSGTNNMILVNNVVNDEKMVNNILFIVKRSKSIYEIQPSINLKKK